MHLGSLTVVFMSNIEHVCGRKRLQVDHPAEVHGIHLLTLRFPRSQRTYQIVVTFLGVLVIGRYKIISCHRGRPNLVLLQQVFQIRRCTIVHAIIELLVIHRLG